MKKYLSILRYCSYYLIGICFVSFLVSLLYYFSNISYKSIANILYIFMILLFFINGFITGSKRVNKGYINGIKYGLVFIIVIYLIGSIAFRFNISLYKILYYVVLILSSIIGSMIGINIKKRV